jgi:hypothetical protein
MRFPILLFGVFLSIGLNAQEKKSIAHISIPELIDKKINLNLSDVFPEVSYIPLESNKDNLIGIVNSLVVDKDFILIYDRKNTKLLQFDGKGSFVRPFMNRGKGPKEFGEISAIDANDNKELLIMREGQFIDIIRYDGTLIKTITLTVTPQSARWLNNDIMVLIFPFPNYLYNEGYEVCFMDRQGKVLKKTLKRPIEKVSRGSGSRARMGWNNGELYYWFHQSDTIYTITKSMEVYPRYALAHDRRHIPVDKYSISGFQPILDQQYTVESYDEWGDYIFINVAYNYHFFQCVFNAKLNLKGNVIAEYNKWTYSGLLNNIDGGKPFWPGSLHKDGSRVNVLDPLELSETFSHNLEIKLKVNTVKQNLLKKEVIDRINDLSNPILMKVR